MTKTSIIALGLLFVAAMLPSSAIAGTYNGTLMVGTTKVSVGCGNSIPCEPTAALGYDGISMVPVELAAEEAGQPFTLSGTSPAGPVDLAVCFYEGDPGLDGQQIDCVDVQLFDAETGTVPATATHATIQLYAGADASYTLTIDTEDGACTPTASTPTAEVDGSSVFVDKGLISVWIYEDTNGVPGIQRGDPVVTDEACGHGADHIVF